MTVLGAIAKRGSLESTAQPLTSSGLADWLGGGFGDDAGVPVTESSVYGLSAWFRAVRLISGTIAALPLHTYRAGTRERARGWALDEPSPGVVTPFEFWQSMYANALSWGAGYARKYRDGGGIVTRLRVIHPSAVEVIVVDPTPDYPSGKYFRVTRRNGAQEILSTDEIFEMPYLSLDGVIGLRPLALFRRSLGIALAVEQTTVTFYRNGTKLSGVLTTEKNLDKGQAEKLQERWRQRTSGPDNAGRVAVLDNGTSFEALAIPPADAELLDSRKFSVTEIARIFGVPPHMLGDVEKSTSWGTGIESQMTAFVQFTLLPWLKLVEQRATREILPGGWTASRSYAEYAVEGLLRGDTAARASFYHLAITDGYMNRNEVRAKENLEPVEGLDEYLVPSNLTLVTVDGNLVPLGGSNAGDTVAA